MSSDGLCRLVKTNYIIIVLGLLTALIIILGADALYLTEHGHTGANITNLNDALWWAVVTISSVGYGDYFPVTIIGRIIAIFMMLSGIGIFTLLISTFAHRRLHHLESRLKSKTELQPILLINHTKMAIKDKIEEIEKLTDEDFDTLIVMLKSLRRTLLEESIASFHCPKCDIIYHYKLRFCSNCGLEFGD